MPNNKRTYEIKEDTDIIGRLPEKHKPTCWPSIVLVAINYDDCELRKLRLERRTFQADLFASEVEHGDVGR